MNDPNLTKDPTLEAEDGPVYYASERIPPDHVGVLVAGVIFMIAGWAGLVQLIATTRPFVAERWLFFLLLQIAVTGTVIPFVRYLNLRFTPVTDELPPGGVIVRQSVWIGLFVVLCAWLRMPRILNLPIIVLLAILFIVIEAFLRTREIRSERSD